MSDHNDGDSNDDHGEGSDNVCRDFLRNVCRRGDRCKYTHPAGDMSGTEDAKLQDKMEFCHDFQNGRCHRPQCKYIHCTGDVEREFKSTGYLPPAVRDQVIKKGVAVDFPAVNGGIPICKDYLKGKCTRGERCKFRHVNPMEYDMEMTAYTDDRRRTNQYANYGFYDNDDPSMMYERRGMVPGGSGIGYSQERKRRCLTDLAGPPELSGPSGSGQSFQLVQEENHQLRTQILELEKRVSDLTATNEFLLDQNAQLRMGVKQTPAVSSCPPPISRQAQSAVSGQGGPMSVHGPPMQAVQGPPISMGQQGQIQYLQ